MTILITQKGQGAQKIEKSYFEKEDRLQEYIYNYPEAIPIYNLQEDKRLFVAKREFPTNSGPIDALAVDQDGNLYVVETKLYKNPDKRTVVAQALDYGASLWKYTSDFTNFIEILNQESLTKFKLSFEDKIKEFYEIDEGVSDNLFDSLRTNLNDGNIKFVILMDTIGDRLKDMIIYINQNSKFDIYAVQLDYYKFEDYEILIPKLFGAEVKKSVNILKVEKQWDESSFMEKVKNELSSDQVEVVNKILEWSKHRGLRIWWGKGRLNGSFFPLLDHKDTSHFLFSVWTSGAIEIQFQHMKNRSPYKDVLKRDELRMRLNQISGLDIPEMKIDKRPSFNYSILIDKQSLETYLNTWDDYIKTIKSSS